MGRSEHLTRQMKSGVCVKHLASASRAPYLKPKSVKSKIIQIAIPSLSNLKMDADPSMTTEEFESHEAVFLLNQARLKLEKDLQATERLLSSIHSSQSMMGRNELNITSVQKCPVCYEIYNKSRTIPVCMPCGHTICKVCANRLKLHHCKISCPLDRHEFDTVPDFLPINHALLEASEEKDGAKCKDHGMLIIGFCLDHQTLLCGKCLFAHKTHNAIDIESPEAQSFILNKYLSFERLEESIEYLIKLWSNSTKSLIESSLNIKNVLLSFISLQKSTETLGKNKFHLGILNCVEEMLGLSTESSSYDIDTMSVMMSSFGKYLETLSHFRKNFSILSDTDKLRSSLPIFDASEKSSESSLFHTLSDMSKDPSYFEGNCLI